MLNDRVKGQIDSIRVMLDDEFSPEGLCRKALAQIENMDFPAQRVPMLQVKLVEFKTTVEAARRQDHAPLIRRAAIQLLHDARGLTQPERPPTPEELVTRSFAGLQAHGWASFTIQDLLPKELRAGDIIVSYDADKIMIRGADGNTRTIKRLELIHNHRPRNLTKDHEADWMKQNTRSALFYRRSDSET
jgi:hypothetical protein